MAGSNPHKGSSHKTHHHSSSNPSGKSRREHPPSGKKPTSSSAAAAKSSTNPDPSPKPTLRYTPNPNPSPKPTPKSGANHNPSPIHPQPTFVPPGPRPGQLPIGPLQPPPPSYGFHMLERRAVVLADGSVRSYFALPPDYDFAPRRHRPELPGPGSRFPPLGPMSPEMRDPFSRDRGHEYFNPMGKRKFGDEGEMMRDDRELAWKRQQLLQLGNAGMNPNGYSGSEFLAGPSNPREMGGLGGSDEVRMAKQMRGGGYQGLQVNAGLSKHNEVDQIALKNAFLHFVKLINENANQKKLYLENWRQGPLNCVACGRSARDFPDMHALIMHTYHPDGADLLVDHLGLHKALCLLMGWNYSRVPDNSKAYQALSADEAAANQDDVILWPPTVVVHNTITGKGKEGRMEGLGNKAMDAKLREFGLSSGKAKSVYGREGHMGITLVRFSADQSGLKDAVRLAEFFEREKRGRKGWARVQLSSTMSKDDENNPNLMELDKKTGEKQRILYGYLGTVFDLDKLDFDTRKKIQIKTLSEYGAAK